MKSSTKSIATPSFLSSWNSAGSFPFEPGKVELLEGQPDARPMIVFEFPSVDAIHAFWDSPEYVPVREFRQGAANLNVWAVAGI